MSDHEHDWRSNPTVQLMSQPPRTIVVCAECGAEETRAAGMTPLYTDDPHTWPKADA